MNSANTEVGSLRGLELRRAVAEELGWSTHLETGLLFPYYVLVHPNGLPQMCAGKDGEDDVLSAETEEHAWQSAPAFESDLGALQTAGVVTEVLAHNLHYGYCLHLRLDSPTAEELAESFARAWLSLRRRGKGTEKHHP